MKYDRSGRGNAKPRPFRTPHLTRIESTAAPSDRRQSNVTGELFLRKGFTFLGTLVFMRSSLLAMAPAGQLSSSRSRYARHPP
jgi:hypothetical protein